MKLEITIECSLTNDKDGSNQGYIVLFDTLHLNNKLSNNKLYVLL